MVKDKAAVPPPTLGEAATRYVTTLSQPAAQDAQPVVYRFVQWFGADRRPGELKGMDVERFVEESSGRGSQGRRLEALRPFLVYLKSAGITATNLSTAMKLRKAESDASAPDNADAVQMTQEGYEALHAELENLKAKRPQIALALKEAMADKDFRENAPLDAARDQQAHVEAQIRRTEGLLKHAVVVDRGSDSAGGARVGSHVVVRDLKTNTTTRYQLVSPSEVNIKEKKISVASPVGKALVDHVQGDEVVVQAPSGQLRLRIEAVEA